MTAPLTAAAVADRLLERLAAIDPEAAAVAGIEATSQLAALHPEAFEERIEARRDALRQLAALPPSDRPDENALRLVLDERLTAEVELDEVGFTRRLLAPLATPVHLVRQLFDDLPCGDAAEAAVVAEHLTRVPAALDDYLRTLTRAADDGHLVARRQIGVVARQCRQWCDQAFFAGVATAAGRHLDTTRAGAADAAAALATAATSAFADDLESVLAPRADDADAVGRQVYTVTSRSFLGAEVDLDELRDWGWSEVDRLRGEVADAARDAAGTEDVAAAISALDLSSKVAVGEPLRQWLQGRLDQSLQAVDGRWFEIPAADAVEARLTDAASGVIYYTPPDAAGTRPGRVWWTVPPGTSDVATWREVSTVHHEGIPGHHLQHIVTAALDGLHPWQRYLCHVHGYAEGWAHYAESLADEIGLIRSPAERLSLRLAELWRACRIVIDLGLHVDDRVPAAAQQWVGAERWTPALGVAMLVDCAQLDRSTATFEVERYLGWPAQALSFRVGSRLWVGARRDAERGAAADDEPFDLRRFHADALALGPMGLDPLRRLLAAMPHGRLPH